MENSQFNRFELVVESGAIPFVLNESRKIAHKVVDVTSFEQECYHYIGAALDRYKDNGREKKALIQRIIREVRNRFLDRRKVKESISIESMYENDSVWEPEDVLANVEGEVLLKEKIALLAQDDPRKRTILEAWIRGCTNDSDISTLLAQRFGGNAKCHRIFIQRFRSRCQSQLTA
ncbi:hypothetical protein MOB72_08200 [Bacillus licheniformis]|uniref:hypothetical protein n=1 Tax=Bacillus licheniformis TaxID=1402 RepID=UPI0022818B18|nr:hypothetical protein [Bacillus licheniformis]MCY7954734.1 hypothetical protein [Bacillus licheniformis]